MTFSARYLVRNIPTFRLGLNTKKSPDEVEDEELVDCENFTIFNNSLVTSPGYVNWDEVLEGSPAEYVPANKPGPYWGGFSFRAADGTLTNVRQRQGTLEYAADGETIWTECTLPTSGSPAEQITLSEIPCTFASLNGTTFWSNGTDSVMSSTDLITWTIPTYGSPAQEFPKSKHVFNNGANRIIFAAQPESKYRIDWTPINDATQIENFQLIDPNGGDEVVGMGKTPDGTNLVFKRNSVYAISNYIDEGIIDVNFIGNASCACPQAVVTTHQSVIWVGWDGVYEIIGGIIRRINGNIEMTGRNDVLRLELFCAAYYNRKVFISQPDADISADYNSQEYIYYLDLPREDATQPYAITRNRRYFGMYFIEDGDFDYGRDITLYVGDSRPSTSGSPVETNSLFAWINDFRNTEIAGLGAVTQGLDGEAQTSYLITKYFTDDLPFFVKQYKKFFSQLKVDQDIEFEVAYRFVPYGEWITATANVETGELEIQYEDGSFGQFSEGFGFASNANGEVITDLESSGNPRGIQFKITVTSIPEVQFYGFATKFLIKQRFR